MQLDEQEIRQKLVGWQDYLYKYAYYKTRSVYKSEELVGEVNVKFLDMVGRGVIKNADICIGYLISMVRTTIIDTHRMAVRKNYLNVPNSAELKGLDAKHGVQQDELKVYEPKLDLKQMIIDAGLRGIEEKILLMRLMGHKEMPYEKIAQMLNIPLGTMKNRHHTAVSKLKRISKKHEEQLKAQYYDNN